MKRGRQQTSDPKPQRVKVASKAALAVGVSSARLYKMQESPWWKPSFKTPDGWDVEAILQAQKAFHEEIGSAPKIPQVLTEQRQNSAADLADAGARLRGAQDNLEEIRHMVRQRLVLPVADTASFCREMLRLLRSRIEEIPYVMARQTPPQSMAFVSRPGGVAPLQRAVADVVERIGQWLSEGTEAPCEQPAAELKAEPAAELLRSPDVVAMATSDDPRLRKIAADIRSQQSEANIRMRRAEQAESEVAELAGSIIAREIVVNFLADLQAIVNQELEALPEQLLKKAGKATKPLIWNAKGSSLLQKQIEKITIDLGEWIKNGLEELEPDDKKNR